MVGEKIEADDRYECPTCGTPDAVYTTKCPWCESPKCETCDMGDDCECAGCISEEEA